MAQNDQLIFDLFQMYKQRCSEVSRYIDFIMTLTNHRNCLLCDRISDGQLVPIEPIVISRELTKTLRANTYLLLYNLVESTMTSAIDTIHLAIESDRLAFNRLSNELKNVTLSHFKRAIKDSHNCVHEHQHPIEVAIVKLGYNKKNLFSGNVDTKEIKNIAQRYGFTTPDPNRKGRDIASKLKDVRDKRNGLAHGRISFEACGEETATDYLELTAHQTTVYLRAVLWSISSYLRNRTYCTPHE